MDYVESQIGCGVPWASGDKNVSKDSICKEKSALKK